MLHTIYYISNALIMHLSAKLYVIVIMHLSTKLYVNVKLQYTLHIKSCSMICNGKC